MDLRDRLDWALKTSTREKSAPEREEPSSHGEIPWGEVVQTPLGTCVRVVEEVPLHSYHGQVSVREIFERHPRALGSFLKSGEREALFPDECLFLDTETTGLAGGSGTVAFLVGLARFVDGALQVEQFFARDFDEEPALLHLVRQRLREYEVWVSYNGKTFDVPLLNQRLVFHRLERELLPWEHIDLLYPVRRFWKSWLGECSLARVEQQLLGVRRESDVPGWMVPGLYFRYLRERDPWPLKPVFDHNVQDVLSLVGVLNAVARLVEQPEAFADRSEAWRAGSLLADAGRRREAVRVLERVLQNTTDARKRKRVLLQLGRLYKTLGERHRALPLWEEASRLPGFSVEPYVELAKYYEHHAREVDRARQWTERGLENLRVVQQLFGPGHLKREEQDLLHRLERLHRKMGGGLKTPGASGTSPGG